MYGGPGIDHPRVDLSRGNLEFTSLLGTDNDSIRPKCVVNRVTLTQELRVPPQVDCHIVLCELLRPVREAFTCTHRHGGLAQDERVLGQQRNKTLDNAFDVPEIGRVLALALRGANRDEVHPPAPPFGCLLVTGRHLEESRLQVLANQIGKTRLVEGNLPPFASSSRR